MPKRKRKVGIVGNRSGWEYEFVRGALKGLGIGINDIIISGGAAGVDTYAQYYAEEVGAEIIIIYPDPTEFSPQRYYNRNQEIAERCDTLIAFDRETITGVGTGTSHTVGHARRLNKPVRLIRN